MRLRHFMILFLGVLLIFSAVWLKEPVRILNGAVFVLIYCLFDLLWTYVQKRVWYFPVSSIISGLILSTVGPAQLTWISALMLPALAVLSKHLLHFGKYHHLFNPAAFALLVYSLYQPAADWWAMSWGKIPLVMVILAGCFIFWKLKSLHILLSFFACYALTSFAFTREIRNMTSLFDGTIFFFAMVMLIEPVTSSFTKRHHGVAYGALIGILSVALGPALTRISTENIFLQLDPLLLALLLGNFIIGMISLPPKTPPLVTS